jgi:hypothetical protein
MVSSNPQDILDAYQDLVNSCNGTVDQYAVTSADAADRATNIRNTFNTIVTVFTGGGGATSALSSSSATKTGAAWIAAGSAIVGLGINYFVAPGDQGTKARANAVKLITDTETAFETFFKTGNLDKDPSKWSATQLSDFRSLFGRLKGACSVSF